MTSRLCKDPLFFEFFERMKAVRVEVRALGVATHEDHQPRPLSEMQDDIRVSGGVIPQSMRLAIQMRNALVTKNSGLAYMMAKRHASRYLGEDDLVQAGYLGLVTAVEKYDPTRGPFSVFGPNWIRTYINIALARAGYPPLKRDQPRRIYKSLSEHQFTRGEADATPFGESLVCPARMPDEIISSETRLHSLEAAINDLPVLDADMIRAKYFEHETADAIERRIAHTKEMKSAKTPAISKETLRVRRLKVLESLKKAIESYEEDA